MTLLFDLFRGVFFFSTLLIIVLLTRGAELIGSESVALIQDIIMPAYLVISGILVGYVLYLMHRIPADTDEQTRMNILTTSYIQGIVIGIFLALVYVYTS